jgi:nucleoprotein TPR
MAETAIELPYLASHYAIPEATLSTLTQAPTADLVNQLLESITKKAHAFDELKSDKLRLEVELENAVRSNESKIKVLKVTVEKGHSEIEDLRKKLHESGMIHILQLILRASLTTYRKHSFNPRK